MLDSSVLVAFQTALLIECLSGMDGSRASGVRGFGGFRKIGPLI